MFFSAREFYNYLSQQHSTVNYYRRMVLKETTPSSRPFTVKEARLILRKVKQRIVAREMYDGDHGLSLHKWTRPWQIVPELAQFQVPVGDFGVGVEVEMGFISRQAAQQVAGHIKDWKHIAIDEEGGHFPLEVTFPPIHYSKLNNKSQVVRYLKYLQSVRNLVVNHTAGNYGGAVGTHVNVSVGGVNLNHFSSRMSNVSDLLQYRLSSSQQLKYFGRRPYGYLYNQVTHIEYKLFNSQLDPDRLRQYIDIAVALTKLVVSQRDLSVDNVVAALEEGYNKRAKVISRKLALANVSNDVPSLALAA